MKNNKILITGVAGFIGFSQAIFFLKKNYTVLGIDNLNKYYSSKYKKLRLKELKKYKKFFFKKMDISERSKVNNLFKNNNFYYIFHFAAQAGVRYSVINPKEYILSNIYGFINILNASSKNKIKAIYYASSSSVYGDQKKYPVTEKFNLFPKNIYAKTKYLNEQIANFYYKKFGISLVGLRLFTVYGKWGRPDMLLFKIFKSHFKNNSFSLNNSGDHFRDFTHIDDVVKIIYLIHKKKKLYKNEIFNICSKNTIYIKKLVLKIKKIINIKYINIPKNKLEVFKTNGENIKIKNEINYRKFNKINNVLPDLIKWYEKEKIYKYY